MDLFGLRRRAAESLRNNLADEGVLLVETGVRGSLTHRDFRAPGRRITLDKRLAVWTVCITEQRLLVRWGDKPYVDVAWRDRDRVAALHMSIDGSALLIRYDAASFSDQESGTIEVRARLADPAAALQLIDDHR